MAMVLVTVTLPASGCSSPNWRQQTRLTGGSDYARAAACTECTTEQCRNLLGLLGRGEGCGTEAAAHWPGLMQGCSPTHRAVLPELFTE